jgi:hypothetical protein
MYSDNPRTTAQIARHPIHTILVPFPIVCFIGALAAEKLICRPKGEPSERLDFRSISRSVRR